METFIEVTAGSLVYMTPHLFNGGTSADLHSCFPNVTATIYHGKSLSIALDSLDSPFYLKQEEKFRIGRQLFMELLIICYVLKFWLHLYVDNYGETCIRFSSDV
jgi:hypothetical protein